MRGRKGFDFLGGNVNSVFVGVGKPLSPERCRMLLALRINVLAKGYSGISLETLKQVIEAFNGKVMKPQTNLPWRLGVAHKVDLMDWTLQGQLRRQKMGLARRERDGARGAEGGQSYSCDL